MHVEVSTEDEFFSCKFRRRVGFSDSATTAERSLIERSDSRVRTDGHISDNRTRISKQIFKKSQLYYSGNRDLLDVLVVTETR